MSVPGCPGLVCFVWGLQRRSKVSVVGVCQKNLFVQQMILLNQNQWNEVAEAGNQSMSGWAGNQIHAFLAANYLLDLQCEFTASFQNKFRYM